MTPVKSIFQASAIGGLSGILLASTTQSWLHFNQPFLLPVLVALWWFVVFGASLWHAYLLSNKRSKPTFRFGMQILQASITALVYFGSDIFSAAFTPLFSTSKNELTGVLQSGIIEHYPLLLGDSNLIVLVAFVLSLTTSGLLFAIITHPSAK